MTRNTATLAWIQIGIIAGLTTSVVYPLLLFAPMPRVGTAFLAAVLGPAIGIGSLGILHLIRVHADSVAASLGALSNLIAGALFCAMALVQLAVRASGNGLQELTGVWLGLDVALDVYIGLGTVCFASAMIRHPLASIPGRWRSHKRRCKLWRTYCSH